MLDLEKLNNYDIISFDIYDTLLIRKAVKPHDVWKILETNEKIRGFAKKRRKADRITYCRSIKENRETSLEEIYSFLPKKWKGIMEKELELERRLTILNKEMYVVWNKAIELGKKVILVSDMYLPHNFIIELLNLNGINKWNGFYLSSDYNCRKSSGKLFSIVLEKENVSPEKILHIGDDYVSDVKNPKSLGIQTLLYTKIYDQFVKTEPFMKKIPENLAGVLISEYHNFKCTDKDINFWNKIGFLMAGVIGFAFTEWLVKTALELNIKNLVFIGRDGYILKKIIERNYPDSFKTDYVYAPRITSIAVLGATGFDSNAIRDRKNYIDTHIMDTKEIYKEYENYINNYKFDQNTAIIDGCSSGFSAQRLIEKTTNKTIFGFYFHAMAKMKNTAAFFSTDLHPLEFQNLFEFLFGAPENPIIGITKNKPVYNLDISSYEEFKVKVSPDICKGAVYCAEILKKNKLDIPPIILLEYINAYIENISEIDLCNLLQCKNATDVEQKNFDSLIYKIYPKREIRIKKEGRFKIIFDIFTKMKQYTFSIAPREGVCFKKVIHEYPVKTGVITK